MEDYKQKYNEALQRAKAAHNSAKSDKENGNKDKITEYTIQLTETIFPELKESEDEKIRKAILELVKQSSHILNPMNQKAMIAWLEKESDKSDYNPYKATIESISAMVEKYAPFDSNLQDFYDNVKVKCKDAIEYEKTFKL